MQVLPGNIFELAEIDNLLAEEWASVRNGGVAVPSGVAVSLAPTSRPRERALANHPTIGLLVSEDGLMGDVRSSTQELPFETDSVQLLVARHLFDVLGPHSGLEEELMRILAPGGTMFLFGFNPASSWRLWWLHQATRGLRMPQWSSAEQTRLRLAASERLQSQCDYLGGGWPSVSMGVDRGEGKRWHGAWSLVARKQRVAARPISAQIRRQRVSLNPGMARTSSRRASL